MIFNTKASMLSTHVNILSESSSKSRFMPHTTEKIATSCQQNVQLSNGHNQEWPSDCTFMGSKRNRDGQVKMLLNINGLDNQVFLLKVYFEFSLFWSLNSKYLCQSEAFKHYSFGLLHQFSLPSTSSEMETIENLLFFKQCLSWHFG